MGTCPSTAESDYGDRSYRGQSRNEPAADFSEPQIIAFITTANSPKNYFFYRYFWRSKRTDNSRD